MKLPKCAGYRLLIKPDYEKKTKSGIMLVQEARVGVAAVDTGYVVAIGETAYRDVGDGTPWVKVGDHIVYRKWGGSVWIDTNTEMEYVIIGDQDPLLILDDTKENKDD